MALKIKHKDETKYKLECDVRINPKYEDVESTEVTIKDTLNWTSMFQSWLSIQNTGLNKEILLKKGTELINDNL